MTTGSRILRSRIGSRLVHPGEILWSPFMIPFEISQNALAREMGVPPRRINEIVNGKRAITAMTAIRLARVFGTSEHFWMALQSDYEIETARPRCPPPPRSQFKAIGVCVGSDDEEGEPWAAPAHMRFLK